MRISIAIMTGCVTLSAAAQAGTTITYTYDKQHRLTSADYSAAQTDAQVTYQYDAANNLDLEVSITDGQYLKSFLLYLARRTRSSGDWLAAVRPDKLEPEWLRNAET